MTAAELVRTAGGFKRGAYTEAADLTRYTVEGGQSGVGEHDTIQIARALEGEPDTDMRLVTATCSPFGNWLAGAMWVRVITVNGEVMHPGTYGIEEGERLSSILERAGGLGAMPIPTGQFSSARRFSNLKSKIALNCYKASSNKGRF